MKQNNKGVRELSRNDILEGRFAKLVFLGVAIEATLALIGKEPLYWTISEFIAGAMVAIGVLGEIHFGGNARAEANAREAEANRMAAEARERAALAERQAAEANLETERIKLLVSWRTISQEELLILKNALSRWSGSGVAVLHLMQDPEPLEYSAKIAAAFRLCGWKTHEASFPLVGYMRFGIRIERVARMNEGLADAIEKAFTDIGIDFLSESVEPSAVELPIGASQEVQFWPRIYVWPKAMEG